MPLDQEMRLKVRIGILINQMKNNRKHMLSAAAVAFCVHLFYHYSGLTGNRPQSATRLL